MQICRERGRCSFTLSTVRSKQSEYMPPLLPPQLVYMLECPEDRRLFFFRVPTAAAAAELLYRISSTVLTHNFPFAAYKTNLLCCTLSKLYCFNSHTQDNCCSMQNILQYTLHAIQGNIMKSAYIIKVVFMCSQDEMDVRVT